jgi:sugar lactone lactonase YvrE
MRLTLLSVGKWRVLKIQFIQRDEQQADQIKVPPKKPSNPCTYPKSPVAGKHKIG